jgi:hypothetical protein
MCHFVAVIVYQAKREIDPEFVVLPGFPRRRERPIAQRTTGARS